MKGNIKRVAFIVGVFPAISETFIINQVADLIDQGIDVTIFAMKRGSEASVSDRYITYTMSERTHYLEASENYIKKSLGTLWRGVYILWKSPKTFKKIFRPSEYGIAKISQKIFYWVYPLLKEEYDIVHCHFGTVATKYLIIRRILNDTSKFITTFYGYDVSLVPQEKGVDCYKELSSVCDKFLVMSENMKSRVLLLGVPEEKIEVHPISIDVESYSFHERAFPDNEKIQITSVGRFVEKKGFDDLLRAIRIVKEGTKKPFVCNIVGDGKLHNQIHSLAKDLEIEDVVDFKGFMKLEEVLGLYDHSHLYVQSSKTARDGDME